MLITLIGTFLALLLGSAYIGLTPSVVAAVNDKFLHFLVFFLLTVGDASFPQTWILTSL